MKIAIIGQQDFGKAVLDAFLARGDEVAGVFCAPEKAGSRPDVLRVAAQEKNLRVFQFLNLKDIDAHNTLRALDVDIGIMAYVLQFAPQEFVNIPKHGTIQYHPSVLPKYRGPSSISWPLICGEAETGLTIFRPTDGLDEGPIILQKFTPVSENDTLGTVYFDRLFPQGVAAMIEAADLVVAGKHRETIQDESNASYEGWCRVAESKINFNNNVRFIHDLIRGCDPAPGAWTTLAGKKVQLFGSKKHLIRTFAAVKGKPGEIVKVTDTAMFITAQGGQIEVAKLKHEDGKKVSPAEFAAAYNAAPGILFGT
jgi:methionyl-tRNA formyltransferase